MEDQPICYAQGSRGISCSSDIASFSEKRKGVRWKNQVGWICKTHYDILAKIQNKPSVEELQQKRVANTFTVEDSAIIPDRDWWDRTLLPSYRDEWISK